MKLADNPDVQRVLQEIVELELAGVIRYTHYSLMISGPNRIPIVAFFQGQASESLAHAQRAGEILSGIGGHPTMHVAPIAESNEHSVQAILEESYAHERAAIEKYDVLRGLAEGGRSVFLEEYARSMLAAEEEHIMELRKMMRDLV